MRAHQIQSWAWNIIERVKAQQPIEDSRVELKSEWIDSQKAARRIAGHANASRGASILWLVGVDEEKGVTGAKQEELADWYAQVQSHFDAAAPRLTEYAIPVDNTTIVALYFDTGHAPFVVKNPSHGTRGCGPVEMEVPWREGTSIRTARRADLLSLLSPLSSSPIVEVLAGTLEAGHPQGDAYSTALAQTWELKLELYVEPQGTDLIAIPFHRCRAWLNDSSGSACVELNHISLFPPKVAHGATSQTTSSTQSEALINGPGRLDLIARTVTEFIGKRDATIHVSAALTPSNSQHPVSVSATLGERTLTSEDEQEDIRQKWVLLDPSIET